MAAQPLKMLLVFIYRLYATSCFLLKFHMTSNDNKKSNQKTKKKKKIAIKTKQKNLSQCVML